MSIGKLFFIEQIRVFRRYYFRSFRFAAYDISLSIAYLFSNPYRVCRRFFQNRGEDNIYAYGETPLTLWAQIAKWAAITKEDHFIDLGCGRGRICFWTHYFIGCRVTGIDWIEKFVKTAQVLIKRLKMQDTQFYCGRITQANLCQASVVYLYTFHSDEEAIDLKDLPLGARVISVSEPLCQQGFVVQKSMVATYPWGKADIYLNVKTVS